MQAHSLWKIRATILYSSWFLVNEPLPSQNYVSQRMNISTNDLSHFITIRLLFWGHTFFHSLVAGVNAVWSHFWFLFDNYWLDLLHLLWIGLYLLCFFLPYFLERLYILFESFWTFNVVYKPHPLFLNFLLWFIPTHKLSEKGAGLLRIERGNGLWLRTKNLINLFKVDVQGKMFEEASAAGAQFG